MNLRLAVTTLNQFYRIERDFFGSFLRPTVDDI